MKAITIGIVVCYFLSSNITAQEVFQIKNKATGTFLNIENGTLNASDTDDDSATSFWYFLKRENGEYRLKNHNEGTYVNIEKLVPQSTEIEHHWWSPLWAIEKVEGTNYIRIRSIWKPTLYLNMQDGLGCTEIQHDWESVLWETERVDPSVLDEKPYANLLNAQKALDAHNSLRREVGVPPLQWSNDLAFRAQLWANKLTEKNGGETFVLEHSGSGENIAGGFVTGDPPEKRILLGWGENEKPNFNPATRKCYESKICGHYTQVVWRKTQRVGCGVGINANGKYILVCNYDPPGNKNREPAF